MTIISAGGKSLKVTADDRLWLLRAVQAEGEPRRAVAEALVNLWAWQRATGRSEQSLAALVRAYAQPVNPRWYREGDLFLAAKARAPEQDRPAMEAMARRRQEVHSARTVFDQSVMAAVEAALAGVHRGDVTDYAAPNVDASSKGYRARSEAEPGRNRLWTRAPGWEGYAAGGGSAVAVLAVAAGVVLWAVAKC